MVVQEQSSRVGCGLPQKSWSKLDIHFYQRDQLPRKPARTGRFDLVPFESKETCQKVACGLTLQTFSTLLGRAIVDIGGISSLKMFPSAEEGARRHSRTFLWRQASIKRNAISNALRTKMAFFLGCVVDFAFFNSWPRTLSRTLNRTNFRCLRSLTLLLMWGGKSEMISRTHLNSCPLRSGCFPRGGIIRRSSTTVWGSTPRSTRRHSTNLLMISSETKSGRVCGNLPSTSCANPTISQKSCLRPRTVYSGPRILDQAIS